MVRTGYLEVWSEHVIEALYQVVRVVVTTTLPALF